MDRIFQFDQLEIIGCNEVPAKDPAMPRLLSAIFSVRDSDTVLFPPYTLGERGVIGPVISTRAEFEDLVATEEVTSHQVGQALPGHELWLDDEGEIHYGPDYMARKGLMEIFEARCQLATRDLKSGDPAAARTHAMIAYSANPRSLMPLVCRAAAEHLLAAGKSDSARIRAELALTEIIAKTHLSTEEFRKLYQEMAAKSFEVKPVAKDFTLIRVRSSSKLFGITNRKPEQFEASRLVLCNK